MRRGGELDRAAGAKSSGTKKASESSAVLPITCPAVWLSMVTSKE
jgi:hypothetical protein